MYGQNGNILFEITGRQLNAPQGPLQKLGSIVLIKAVTSENVK